MLCGPFPLPLFDFQIPVPIGSIPSQFHSVRAGLSDAYYFDEVTSAGK